MWLLRKTESRRKLALAAKGLRVAARVRERVGVGEYQKVEFALIPIEWSGGSQCDLSRHALKSIRHIVIRYAFTCFLRDKDEIYRSFVLIGSASVGT